MPLALIIAAIQVCATYILIHAGYNQLHALIIVLGTTVVFVLIAFIILVLAVRDDAKLNKLFKAEVINCIQEVKVFMKNLTNKKN